MEFTGEIDDLVVDYSANRQKLVLRSNVDITDIFESFKGKELDVKIEKRKKKGRLTPMLIIGFLFQN